MDSELNYDEDEKLQKFRMDYIERIRKTNIFCPDCGNFTLMSVSKKTIAHISFNCLYCKKEWSVDLLNFFQVDWIDQKTYDEFVQRGRNMEDLETMNDLEQDRMVIIINCLTTWMKLIKTNKIIELFNLVFDATCSSHSECLVDYYCHDCLVHFCDKCSKMNVHNGHKIQKISEILNRDKIQEKVDIFEDLKQLRLQNNSLFYKKMDTLLEKKISSYNSDDKYLPSFKDDCDKITDERIELAKNFKYTCLCNDCWASLFQLVYAMYKYKNNNRNYFILHSLNELSHFYIDNSIFPKDIDSDNDLSIILDRAKEVSNHLKVQFLLLPYEKNNMISIYETMKDLKTYPVKNIILNNSKDYGKHTVKINHVLVLQNGDLVLGTSRPTIKIINAKTLKCVNKFKGHKGGVNYLCCAGKEHFLSCSDDGKIMKWETKNLLLHFELALKLTNVFTNKNEIYTHKGKVLQLLVKNDKIYISLSTDKTIKIWEEKRSVTLIGTLTETNSTFISMVLLKDCRLVTASEDKLLRFWDLGSFEQIESQHIPNVDCLSTGSMKSLNDKLLLIGGKNQFSIIDVNRNVILQTVFNVSQVGTFLILSNSTFICFEASHINVYDIKTNKCKNLFETKVSHTKIVSSVESLSKTEFVTVSHDSSIKRWTITS